MSKFQQDRKQKLLIRNTPSTRKQEHESATSVLRIVTLTNNNPITLRFSKWRPLPQISHFWADSLSVSRAV